MISTHWRAPHEPAERELRLMDVLARQAADLIERTQAERRKDEFLATLAHELRNPLAPLRNVLEILHRSDDPRVIGQAQQMMRRQIDRMVRLVDDLLDLSRVTTGKFNLQKTRIQLADVVRSAVEDVKEMIHAAGHELVLRLPDAPVLLDADAVRLGQVFTNLLSNAAKYTPNGGRIELAAEPGADAVTVIVSDNGVGIPPASLERIFEMFGQLDTSIERGRGGLGVGLSLVKSLVEMHGGWVRASSDGSGKGSKFEIWLPTAAAAPVAHAASAHAPEPSIAVRRILVVDDNRDAADSLATLLQMLGHDVRTAFDGVEALEVAAEFRPDVALLDIGLPKISGYEVARHIRATRNNEVMLIAVTGWGQEADRKLSEEAGFDCHLTKPMTVQALQEALGGAAPGPMVLSTQPARAQTF
jgi:CheY-like chemotaxis protein